MDKRCSTGMSQWKPSAESCGKTTRLIASVCRKNPANFLSASFCFGLAEAPNTCLLLRQQCCCEASATQHACQWILCSTRKLRRAKTHTSVQSADRPLLVRSLHRSGNMGDGRTVSGISYPRKLIPPSGCRSGLRSATRSRSWWLTGSSVFPSPLHSFCPFGIAEN